MFSVFGYADIGLDLGTANTLIYMTEQGIAINEPSLVTINAKSREIEAVGTAASSAVGRTPRYLQSARPIRNGVVTDLRLCQEMLRRFLAQAHASRSIGQLRVVAAVPNKMSDVERNAFRVTLKNAGAGEVLLLDQTLAAARGAQLDIDSPVGRMVVDIGAGVTGISLLSLSQTVCAESISVGGEDIDAAISTYVRHAHQLTIGERTAERIKVEIGSAEPLRTRLKISIKGRCMVKGIPREIELMDDEIQAAIAPVVEKMMTAVHRVLEEAPPELSSDLLETGIFLTGGTALLRRLDYMMSHRFGIPVCADDNPLVSVVVGLAHWIAENRLSESSFRQARICRVNP